MLDGHEDEVVKAMFGSLASPIPLVWTSPARERRSAGARTSVLTTANDQDDGPNRNDRYNEPADEQNHADERRIRLVLPA